MQKLNQANSYFGPIVKKRVSTVTISATIEVCECDDRYLPNKC